MLKLGVMGSTKGTDLQAIIDAIELGKIDAQINMVISNNEGAFILKRAKFRRVAKLIINRAPTPTHDIIAKCNLRRNSCAPTHCFYATSEGVARPSHRCI